MAAFSESPLRNFRSTFFFALRASLASSVLGGAALALLALTGAPYPILSVIAVLFLSISLRAILVSRNRLGSPYRKPLHERAGTLNTLYQAAFIGVLNGVFFLAFGGTFGHGNLFRAGPAMATPYWWFETAFYGLLAGWELGSSPVHAVLDSSLFLGAHKGLAEKLVTLFWLPLMLAGWFLPDALLFPITVSVWIVGPALIFASWLHPGDFRGTPRRVIPAPRARPDDFVFALKQDFAARRRARAEKAVTLSQGSPAGLSTLVRRYKGGYLLTSIHRSPCTDRRSVKLDTRASQIKGFHAFAGGEHKDEASTETAGTFVLAAGENEDPAGSGFPFGSFAARATQNVTGAGRIPRTRFTERRSVQGLRGIPPMSKAFSPIEGSKPPRRFTHP